MKIKCLNVKVAGYVQPNVTVGKEYETTYVEKKDFLNFGQPYFEFIDDNGEPCGWAPCDIDWIKFEKYPSIADAHGIEGTVPVERLHEVNPKYREEFLDDTGAHKA